MQRPRSANTDKSRGLVGKPYPQGPRASTDGRPFSRPKRRKADRKSQGPLTMQRWRMRILEGWRPCRGCGSTRRILRSMVSRCSSMQSPATTERPAFSAPFGVRTSHLLAGATASTITSVSEPQRVSDPRPPTGFLCRNRAWKRRRPRYRSIVTSGMPIDTLTLGNAALGTQAGQRVSAAVVLSSTTVSAEIPSFGEATGLRRCRVAFGADQPYPRALRIATPSARIVRRNGIECREIALPRTVRHVRRATSARPASLPRAVRELSSLSARSLSESGP